MSIPSDVVYAESGAHVSLENGLIALRFDRATGRWLSLRHKQDDAELLHAGDLLSPLLLTVGGRATATRDINQLFSVADTQTVGLNWQCQACVCRPDEEGGWLVMQLQEGDWQAELLTRLEPGRARVQRRVRLIYHGAQETLLRSLLLRLPYAQLGEPADSFVEAPGYPTRPGQQVASLWHGTWGALSPGTFCDAPAWHPPLVGLHHPKTPRSLCCWAWTETEPFFPQAERAEPGMLFSHRIYLADRFRAGHTLEWGTQYLEVHPTDWLTALRQFQNFYEEIGFTVPQDTPDWARAADMFEVHVGTLSGTDLAPYPTYAELIADLPQIKAKGFDIVYIMPHVPFPSYAVIDYFNLDIHQGDAQGFRELIQRAHALGLKVFMDVTIHGCMDRRAQRQREGRAVATHPPNPLLPEAHPYLSEHPEWFSRNEAGEIAMTYTYAFDHADPSWQEFMEQVFRYYVEAFDVDGFRVDSHTWNFFPNWAQELPYPASRSFYASEALFRRIRQTLQAIKPEVVFYTETAGPLLYSSHALGYNYDETWMLVAMLPLLSRSGILCHFLQPGHIQGSRITAQEIAQWLTQWRLSMPRGVIKVRSLDNHDTYWVSNQFRREIFGVEATCAIVAFFAFLDGGFMDYKGADAGLEAFYKKVLHLRRTLLPFKQGTCDYLAARPTAPMIFAPLWQSSDHTLLPLIHFDNRSSFVGLPGLGEHLPSSAKRFRVFDWMTGREMPGPQEAAWSRSELAGLTVELEPYGVRLLAIDPC